MTDTAKQTALSAYRAQFDELGGSPQPDWLADRRRAAMGRFEAQGLPTRKLEDWKYTNLGTLSRTVFAPPTSQQTDGGASAFEEAIIPGLEGPRAVFSNGVFDAARSRIDDLPAGVTLLPLSRALDSKAELLRPVLGDDGEGEDSLHALNTALLGDGLFLHVAAGVALGHPLTIIHLADDGFAERAAQLRHVVVLDDNARASLIEVFAGTAGTAYWTNVVRDLRCGAGAELGTVTLVEEGAAAVHTGHSDVRIDRDGRFDQVALMTGGQTVRHEVRVSIDGEGAEADLSGAYLGAKGQSFTVFTEIDHRVPHGRSNQLYRGVLDAGGHSAFQGRVIVREGAQKTVADQSNHNLLLDRSAEADTKPELEIYADDVKCSHGATVGELDDNMLFYLESRGIDPETARAILVEAFVGEVIERIEALAVRDKVSAAVADWMKRQGAALS